MDLQQATAARGERLLALASVASAAAAAAFALGRLFSGATPALKLAAAAILSAAIAGVLERRGLALAIVASAVAFLFAAALLIYPETTRFGLPTMTTLREMRWALGQFGPEVRAQVAPTPPLAPLLLSAAAAAWVVAFSAHAFFVRAGAALAALLPAALLFAFPDVVLADGPRPFYAALMLTAALFVMFADGLRRIRLWGDLRPWPGYSRRRLMTGTTTLGARRVAVAVVGLAAFLPWLIPGFGAGGHSGAGLPGSGKTQIDPFVSIQANLTRRQPLELFEVAASRPAYWRLISLDRFDGVTWTSSDASGSSGRVVRSATPLPRPPAAPSPPPADRMQLAQDIRIVGMEAPWLPMAYEARSVSFGEGTALYDPDAASAAIPGGVPDGYHYRVDSQLPIPTPAELDAAADPAAPGALSAADYRRYTQLPAQTRGEISGLARRITGGQPNAYREMIAVQNWLRSSFTYDETAQTPEGTKSPLLYFLLQSRRGFCQQFASSMAAMARSLGYPSRVAVGFLPGYDIRPHVYAVTTSQAHAWPEVYFPGVGWVAFEPTPSRHNPVASGYQNPPDYQTPGCKSCASARPKVLSSLPRGFHPPRRPPLRQARHSGTIEFTPAASRRHIYLAIAGLVVLALAVAALILIPPAKILARRLRRLRARDSRSAVLVAYRIFESRASDLGMGRATGETATEFAGRIRSAVRMSNGDLDRLTDAAVKAAYARDDPDPGEVGAARSAARAALRDIRRATSIPRRIMGLYRLEALSSPYAPRGPHR